MQTGYDMDLSIFYRQRSDEITVVTDIMRNFTDDSKIYVILLERNSIAPIIDYLDQIGIDGGRM